MKILRLIKRAARLDRLRNADIRRELEIENILDFVERGMEDSRYHKKNIWNEHHTREDLWNDNIELRKNDWQALCLPGERCEKANVFQVTIVDILNQTENFIT